MVIVSSEDAVRVISAHAPRIIYLVEQTFDLAGEIETAREELDDVGVCRATIRIRISGNQDKKAF